MATTVSITGVAHGGHGVSRIDGQVCFVPYALPGDTVEVRVVRKARGVLWGEIERVVEPSPHRCAPCCPYFGACGGCTWLHFAYPGQAEWKQRIVKDALERIAGVAADVEWVEDEILRLGYRTRAEFHGDAGRLGFYAPESHAVVDIARCPLCHERLNAILTRLRETRIEGPVEITVNPEGSDVLIWSKQPLPRIEGLLVAADTPRDGAPARFFFDSVPIVNGTFSQSSLLLNRVLVRTVHDLIGPASRILDLYCGNGNLSLGLASPANQEIGVPGSAHIEGLDHNRAAVLAANACGLGTYRAASEPVFERALSQSWDVVLLDPPRTGAKAIAAALARCATDAIVYVSCDPATLARDLKTLMAGGWRVARVAVVDLFPHTWHVETVCRLER